MSIPNESNSEPSIEECLRRKIDVQFKDVPLADAMTYISEQSGLQIVLCEKKLEEASVRTDAPVSKTLKRVSVAAALRLLLKDLELTFVDRDEVIQITTPEDAESQLQTRVYDCRDLLAMLAPDVPKGPMTTAATPTTNEPSASAGTSAPTGGLGLGAGGQLPQSGRIRGGGMIGVGGSAQRGPPTELEKRTDQLVELVTATIKPDSWDDVGGPGAIDTYNGLFVVSQTADVQTQVEHLFDMLRQAAGLDLSKAGKVVR